MPEIISLTAEPRERAGKGAARAARRSGRVPGIIYGGSDAPVQITLEPRALAREINHAGFFATIVDVAVGGTVHRTLPRDVQHHPISDRRFMSISCASARRPGHGQRAGRLHQPGWRTWAAPRRHPQHHPPYIDVVCSVDAIPDRLTVDLDGLEIGDSIHIEAMEDARGRASGVVLAQLHGRHRRRLVGGPRRGARSSGGSSGRGCRPDARGRRGGRRSSAGRRAGRDSGGSWRGT